jgi:hypothetical protein
MAKFIIVTVTTAGGPQQQAVNIDAITRYIPVKADSRQPERSTIFLMGPAASEDRFECMHTFQELLTGCLKTCQTSQATDHEVDHRHTDHGFTRLG